MATQIPHRLIERAVRRFELESRPSDASHSRHRHITAPPAPPGRVITLSRQLGSGGRRIAEQLSEWLGWQIWDREILDALAAESSRGLRSRLFEALDEQGRTDVEATVAALFGQVSDFSYHYLLPKAILTIAQRDAIILGRAAHLFLPHALKVRIVAPDAVRQANLARYDGLEPDVARQRLVASDREREAFQQAAQRHLSRARGAGVPWPEYDLVLNAALLGIEPTARLILQAAQMRFALVAAAAA